MTNALKNSIARLGNKLDEHKKDAVPMKAALDSLVPYARQARTEFNEESLGELADSIKEIGVVEPLLVRPMGNGKFEIIAGERRWRAARIASLVEVPVLVRPMDDATADKVHLAENIHRENLSTLDLRSACSATWTRRAATWPSSLPSTTRASRGFPSCRRLLRVAIR